MEGEGLTKDVRRWFERSVPKPTVPNNWAGRAMVPTLNDGDCGFRSPGHLNAARPGPRGYGTAEGRSGSFDRKLVWIGGTPVVESIGRGQCRVILPSRNDDADLRMSAEQAAWVAGLIRSATPNRGARYPVLKDVRAQYPAGGPRGFDSMLRSAAWKQTRAAGLLLV
mgnify:FL=1